MRRRNAGILVLCSFLFESFDLTVCMSGRFSGKLAIVTGREKERYLICDCNV